MKHYILTVVFVVLYTMLSAQEPHVTEYIEKYKEVAISEMLRTGVPASIKLAQGILESDAGRSDLASNSNNHFGIKCGPVWDGNTFYKKDDDRDRRGRLIKSCFRVFQSPQESFRAHSEFLLNPNKSYRYGFLFTLDDRDYKSWAWGLKESGYATNPRYAVLLISIIERYQLYHYDYYEKLPDDLLAFQPPPPARRQAKVQHNTPQIKPKPIATSWKSRGTDHLRVIKEKVINNGLELVYAQKGDTPKDLAARFDVPVNDLIDFNEKVHHTHQKLATADRIYLEEKKKKYSGTTQHHTVLKGETMYEIAQIYGLKLDHLFKRNRLKHTQEPRAGEKISLRKKVKKKNRPATRSMKRAQASELLVKEVSSGSNHVVRAGDTLYSIAKKYKLSVDELKYSNDLGSSLIMPGQVLNIASR